MAGKLTLVPLALGLVACDREEQTPRPPSPSASEIPAGTLRPHRCRGATLEEQVDGQFRGVNQCQTAAHCNPALGQCMVDACVLGRYQCHGAALERCESNGWTQVRRCTSAQACEARTGTCRTDL